MKAPDNSIADFDENATTSLQQRIEELEEKVQLYERIIEHAPVSIFVKNREKQNLINNKMDRKTLDRTKEEILGKSNHEMFKGENLKKINDVDDYILSSGRIMTNEEEFTINGNVRYFIATRGPYYDKNGEISGVFGVSQEITKQKKIEELLQQEDQMNRAKTLILGLSNDINNIVLSITSQAQELKDQLEDPKLSMLVDNILESADVASDIFRHLEKSETALSETTLQATDINSTILKVITSLELDHYDYIDTEVKLCTGELIYPINQNQLIQILNNLIINAIDSIQDKGKLTIITEILDLSIIDESVISAKYMGLKPMKYIIIKICDTGTGILPDHLTKIYTPFFSTKKSSRNSGLGLYITYDLVKHYSGEIILSTELDQGTTFEVIFPYIIT